MIWWKILLIVAAVILLALIGAGWYLFNMSIVRAKKEPEEEEFFQGNDSIWKPFREKMVRAQKWLREQTEEMVTITSFDGLKLTAFYVPAEVEKPKGTLIVFHGYRSLATVDFIPEVEFLHSLGYRLIVPYQRSHGLSEGKYITYGVNESVDCRDWARYVDKRFPGEDIFLMGISMGCATVVMSAGEDLPGTVRGIVADCGFTTPWDIMAHVAKKDYKLPAFPLLNVVDLYARCLAKYSLKQKDTRKILAATKHPVLFLHGKDDDFVPLYMAQQNFEAYGSVSGCGDKEMYLVAGAAHAQSYCKDPQGCQQHIAAFFEKYHS